MPVEHGSRPRPFGLPNLSPDGGGGTGGRGNLREPMSMMLLLSQWNRENPPKGYVETGMRQQTLADYMFGRVIKIENDISRSGDAFSKELAWKVKWSYLALALPFMFKERQQDYQQSLMLNNYERLRKEQTERGEDKPGIELSDTQVKTLQFVLDEAEVPVKLGDAPVCVFLYPLEQVMHSIELRERRRGKEAAERVAQSYVTETGNILRVIKSEDATTTQPKEETDSLGNQVIDFIAEKNRRRTQP
jgi:hypothetical protein